LAEDYRSLIRRVFHESAPHLALPSGADFKLERYCVELERWNHKINLTALRGELLVCKLILEPIWIAAALDIAGVCVDIGSGNGSPAVPIRIVLGTTLMHMVEARARRAAFLRHVVSALELEHVWIHRAEFESVVDELPVADWITIQAVNPSTALLNAIRRMSKPSTALLWITSETARNAAAENRFPVSNFVSLPFSQTVAVVIRPMGDPS
jgi:16S rRNA (guanine527-N7)-methyltransferase